MVLMAGEAGWRAPDTAAARALSLARAEAARDRAVIAFAGFLLWLLLVFVMVFGSGAIVSLLFIDIYNPGADVAGARFAWLPIYGLAAFLLVLRLPHTLRLVSFAPLLALCVLVAGISMFWSADPALTLRRGIALMMTTCLGLALASWLSWARLIQGVAVAFLFLALLSVAVVAIDPLRGLMQEIYPGAWRGPWVQKNDLGGMMTKGLIAAMGAFAIRPKRAWLWIPTGLLCFALVLLSTSKTALLISLGSIAMFLWIYAFRSVALLRPVVVAGLVGGIGIVSLALALFPVETLGLIGKDPTFTGRTDIWRELGLAIRQQWLLGYGYGAFWMDPLGPSYMARSVLEWDVPSAHNGWVETWLSGGIVLVALFGLHMLMTLGACVGALRRGGRECYWVILFVLAYIGFSLSESAILQQNDLTWALFVAASAKLLSGERDPHPKAGRGAAREAAYNQARIAALSR